MSRLALRYVGHRPGAPLGNFAGATVTLVPGDTFPVGAKLVLGRSASAGLRIGSAVVARAHASVETDGDALRVVDCNSTNGTQVNGERIRSVLLRAGDRVTLAEAFDFDVVALD